ncbi:MAG: tetratricopeptide repeat protein [Rikenellaceae bacterium]|nr:tetratricopeptide repeat protein [Rikenellaceae bacterium]
MPAPINRVVRVFIASSDELTPERNEFDTLFAHLNTIFEARGISLKTEKWEFLDSSAGPLHKQEEYNRVLKTCDICVVVFWQKFGDYTKAELDVAYNELCAGRKPTKLYIYFKEPGDVSAEMQAFKESFDKEYSYGHFYGKFSTLDKLQLDFVLQLERFLHSNLIKVEDSQVKVDQLVVAHLDNIPFAADNERYRELREQLQELNEDIADLESSAPLSADKEQRLNKKKQKRNEIREKLQEHEQLLLGAAVRVAQYTGERISERMKRAIAFFNEGKVSEANAVLDEAERDADEILRGVKELKAVGKQSVDELLVKASYMLADEQYPIEERIEKTHNIYQKAHELALECNYEEEKLYKLLYEYCDFLVEYAKFNDALVIAKQSLELSEKLYGENHPNTATSYNTIGLLYDFMGDYDTALEYYNNALAIRKQVLGENHSDTATSYNNIGLLYNVMGEGDSKIVLEYLNKALAIRQQVLGDNHPDTAASYNNIGVVYRTKGDCDAALKYYNKALTIKQQVLGENHSDTVSPYINIGNEYYDKGDYDTALEYYNKALAILKQKFTSTHPNVLATKQCISECEYMKAKNNKYQ